MFTRPPDLPDAELARALRDGWGLVVVSMEYRPVGFGSHHWEVVDDTGVRWFVTVDEDPPIERLRAALATTVALRDSGATFVAAPRPTRDGEPLRVLGRFAVACYPFLDGESFVWGEDLPPEHCIAVLDMLVQLHATSEDVQQHALVDDFVISHRAALTDLDGPDAGPYSAGMAALLAEYHDKLRGALTHYDALVAQAPRDGFVLTHGEPHPGNTMHTPNGWMFVDWDTVMRAPPERDLWDVDPGDGSIHRAYTDATGRTLQPSLLELYRVRWDLADLALYVARFRAPHAHTTDDEKSWEDVLELVARF